MTKQTKPHADASALDCSAANGGSEDCYDSIPPRLRVSGIAIAGDLVRQVDCQHRPIACEAAKKILELTKALDESVKLQTHYAELLNMHDGGERIGFASGQEWIARLREVGTICR